MSVRISPPELVLTTEAYQRLIEVVNSTSPMPDLFEEIVFKHSGNAFRAIERDVFGDASSLSIAQRQKTFKVDAHFDLSRMIETIQKINMQLHRIAPVFHPLSLTNKSIILSEDECPYVNVTSILNDAFLGTYLNALNILAADFEEDKFNQALVTVLCKKITKCVLGSMDEKYDFGLSHIHHPKLQLAYLKELKSLVKRELLEARSTLEEAKTQYHKKAFALAITQSLLEDGASGGVSREEREARQAIYDNALEEELAADKQLKRLEMDQLKLHVLYRDIKKSIKEALQATRFNKAIDKTRAAGAAEAE